MKTSMFGLVDYERAYDLIFNPKAVIIIRRQCEQLRTAEED